jgi:predicted PurR-regulated permease PerM
MAPVVIRRWVQLVLLPLALLGLWALARAIGTLFLVLVVASLVALVLAPLVRVLARVLPRGLAILFAYLTVIVVVGLIAVGLAAPVANQLVHFEHNLPALTREANHDLANIQRFFDRHGIKIHIEKQGQSALSTLEKDLIKRSGAIVSFSQGLLSKAVSVGIDLVLILVLSIYMLVYAADIGRLVRRLVPGGDGTPEDDYPTLVQRAVSGYVRGQLLFSLTMGVAVALTVTIFGLVGLFPAGTTYSWFFGVFYGLMEFIPYVGPILGPVPALLVALFEHPISALWLLIAFIGLQQLEGHVVAPLLFRRTLRINPIVIIVALLIGDKLYGIAGALVALPVISVLRITAIYLRRNTVLEPWGRTPLDEPPTSGPVPPTPGHTSPGPMPPTPPAPEPADP